MSDQAKPRVAVVFGGRSEEHGISCVTAGSVLQALDPARYDVVPIGISRNGDWVLVEGGLDQLRINEHGDLPQISHGRSVALVQSEGGTARLAVVSLVMLAAFPTPDEETSYRRAGVRNYLPMVIDTLPLAAALLALTWG